MPASVAVVTDQFFFLGIHAQNRVPGLPVGLGLSVDVKELPVAVRALLTFQGLGVGLQAKPLLMQQRGDGVWTSPVALGPQRRGECTGRLRRPPQRRHRISALVRFNQRKQRRQQPGIDRGQPLPTPARQTRPAQRQFTAIQITHSPRDRVLRGPRSPGHRPDPTMPQHLGLGPHQQTTLPLIQMREKHPELHRQRLPNLHRHTHTSDDTTPGRNASNLATDPNANTARPSHSRVPASVSALTRSFRLLSMLGVVRSCGFIVVASSLR